MNVFDDTGPPGPPEPAGPEHRSQHCLLFAVDVAGFTEPGRDDRVQLAVRGALYALVRDAFDGALLGWAQCLHEDRGDGMLVVVPMRMPSALLADPLAALLARRLREHNRAAPPARRIRLRAAAHIGEVHRDRHGLAGVAVNHLFRLLDAPALRRALADSAGELALIASDYLYDSVLRHRPGRVDPGAFWPVEVQVKQTRARGWVHLPHAPDGTPALRAGTTRPAPPALPDAPDVPDVPAFPAPAAPPLPAGRDQRIAFFGTVHVAGDLVTGDKTVRADRPPEDG